MRRLVALAVALPLLFPGAGCSLLLVRSPVEPASPSEPVQCDSSPASPALEVVGGIGLALGSLFVMAIEASFGGSSSGSGVGTVGLAASTAVLGSAAWGFRQGSACRAARVRSLAGPSAVIVPSPTPGERIRVRGQPLDPAPSP